MSQRPHLSRALLDAYCRGQASPHELAVEVARVLEGECAECAGRLAGAGVDYDDAVQEASLGARREVSDMDTARRHLPAALQSLVPTWPEALLQAAGEERFHTPAFVEYQVQAAWDAMEGEAWRPAHQAADLAAAAAARLDVTRHGRLLVTLLQAEVELVRARVAVSRGRDRDAERALAAIAVFEAEELSEEVQAAACVGRAVLSLRHGDRKAARRALERGQTLVRDGAAGRWAWAVQTMLAVVERRAGRPEAAVGHLDLLRGEKATKLPGPWRWPAARELVAALVADGRTAEAEAAVARCDTLRGGTGPGGTARDRAERTHLRATLLRHLGQPEESAALLWQAFREYLALGLGVRAATTAGELARVMVTAPRGHVDPDRLGSALEELATRCQLPGEVLDALAGLAGNLARGTLGPEDLDELEDELLVAHPPWGPARHERG